MKAFDRIAQRSLLLGMGILTGSGMLSLTSQAQEFDFTPTEPATEALSTPPPAIPTSPAPPDSIPTMPLLPSVQTAPPPVTTSPPPITSPINPVIQANPATAPVPTVAVPSTPSFAPAPPINTTTAYSYYRREGSVPPNPAITRGELPQGTTIPLTVYREITFPPFQAISGNLEVVVPVQDRFGQAVIPAGSRIWGTFEPVYEVVERFDAADNDVTQFDQRLRGTRFVADRITIQNATYLVSGESNLLPTASDPNASVTQTALKGAGYGAAGGLALGLLTGGIGFVPLLAGSLTGAAAGSTNVDRVVTLTPNTQVEIQLTDDLIIN